MTSSDGYQDEMRDRSLSDQQIEALLTGDPTGAEDLDSLAELLAELRGAVQVEVPAELAAAHVAAAAQAARHSTVDAAAPRRETGTVPRARRRIVFSGFLSTLLGKVLAGSVALAAAGGAAAATGTLPDPAQSVVAEWAEGLGIELPSPELPDETTKGQPEDPVAEGREAPDDVLGTASQDAQEHCTEEHAEEAVDCDVLEGIFESDPTDIRTGEEGAELGTDLADSAGASDADDSNVPEDLPEESGSAPTTGLPEETPDDPETSELTESTPAAGRP